MKKKTEYFILIAVSILLSWILAMSADLDKLELGALVNFIFPILFGIITLVFYLISCYFINTPTKLKTIAIILSIMNILFGMFIRFVDF